MHFGSRLFVAVLFSLLALAFWAVTIQLYLEFGHDASVWGLHKSAPDLNAITASLRAHDNEIWFLLLTHYSDLFLFFPVFGTIALIAFFTPACVFVDMYWNTARLEPDQRIPLSRLRFLVGLIVALAASFSLANYVQGGKERTLWQLKPEVLKTDRGEACTNGQSCARVAFLDALANLRRTSRERVTLYDLGRACTDDWFVDPPRPIRPPRYCPVSTNILGKPETLKGTWVDDRTCCAAQQRFDAAVKAKYANPANRSQTNTFEAALWPAHMFFLLILLALSALLAFRRNRVEELYPTYSNAIDRGVLIGTMAMVFLPLMHNGSSQFMSASAMNVPVVTALTNGETSSRLTTPSLFTSPRMKSLYSIISRSSGPLVSTPTENPPDKVLANWDKSNVTSPQLKPLMELADAIAKKY